MDRYFNGWALHNHFQARSNNEGLFLLWTTFAYAARCPNNHFYDSGTSSCKPHGKCKQQAEVKYAGPNNDVKCEIRQPCHHTYCRIATPEHYELVDGKMKYRSSGHKFGHERVIVKHDHKDHDFGSTHHYCVVNKRTMQCQCMCHNESLIATLRTLHTSDTTGRKRCAP